uniref:Uncharacterized protein n=1 Tax=Romanomermis culicivorax TaxID=13658 RepID=A0A915JMN8_ROMCU
MSAQANSSASIGGNDSQDTNKKTQDNRDKVEKNDDNDEDKDQRRLNEITTTEIVRILGELCSESK